eukprot:TRINITY_DN44409_c0_g1_i1.p1 TRINITY_DN44409_c0_g1~~TRINITY_DN44409_c0_g1_i1.p1  ORF type:complete len:437 (-),score=81.03 TRINITY_DN44409_c0_g1_i1:61-1371(-)
MSAASDDQTQTLEEMKNNHRHHHHHTISTDNNISDVSNDVSPLSATTAQASSSSRNSFSGSHSKRRLRALSPDSALSQQYNMECACSECENQDIPEKLPDLPLSLDSLLVKDMSEKSLKSELPKAFRMDEGLQASASAQLTQGHLAHILKKIGREDCPGSVTVVDLRQESHGFANGIPFSWYRCRNLINFGKTKSAALICEIEALDNLQANINKGLMPSITLHEIRVKLLGSVYTAEELVLEPPVSIESEEQICSKLGMKYVRFPVVDHHHPDEIVADAFVRFITGLLAQDFKDSDNLPEKRQWLHFHCKGGRGRSTSFIAMYEMLRYYSGLQKGTDLNDEVSPKNKTVEDFVLRQSELGGSHLFKPPKCKNKQWKMVAFKNRERFLRSFHEYCEYLSQQNELGAAPRQSWYDWIDIRLQTPNSNISGPEEPMADE